MDPIKVNQDEIDSPNSIAFAEAHEIPNTDAFKCSKHSEYKIEALFVNEQNNNFRLACLKCIIEGGTFNKEQGYRVLTIKDLFQNYVNNLDQSSDKSFILHGEELRRSFIGFMARDYASEYNEHIQGQYKILDLELTVILEELQKIKEKFREIFTVKTLEIDGQADAIKNEVGKILTDGPQLEQPNYNSVEEVYNFLYTLDKRQDVFELFKEIYLKIKDRNNDGSYSRSGKILGMNEEFENMFESLKQMEVNTKSIREISEAAKRVQSSKFSMFKKIPNLRNENKHQLKLNIPRVSEDNLEDDEYLRYSHQYYNGDVDPLKIKGEYSENSYDIKEEPHTVLKKRRRVSSSNSDSQSLKNIRKSYKDFKDKGGVLTNPIKTRFRQYLIGWIKKRITAYLVFRNTISSFSEDSTNEVDINGDGLHINRIMGKKWKSLSKEESEVYFRLADGFKERFLAEIYDNSNYEDFEGFLDALNRKTHTIRREE